MSWNALNQRRPEGFKKGNIIFIVVFFISSSRKKKKKKVDKKRRKYQNSPYLMKEK